MAARLSGLEAGAGGEIVTVKHFGPVLATIDHEQRIVTMGWESRRRMPLNDYTRRRALV
jgi:hypothetical protein